jgi:hypothetical protein
VIPVNEQKVEALRRRKPLYQLTTFLGVRVCADEVDSLAGCREFPVRPFAPMRIASFGLRQVDAYEGSMGCLHAREQAECPSPCRPDLENLARPKRTDDF